MNKLTSSLEDYIEAIYMILEKNPVCRVTDIMKLLKVSKPSIVSALSTLKKENLITQEKYGFVQLTTEGRKVAKKLYSKHRSIRRFLISLFDLKYNEANDIACKIEHVMPEKVIKQMQTVSEDVKACPAKENVDDCLQKLSMIKAGKTVRLLNVCGGRGVCARINRMGLTNDSMLLVVRNDGAGPIIIEQDGSRIVIGRSIASRMSVENA